MGSIVVCFMGEWGHFGGLGHTGRSQCWIVYNGSIAEWLWELTIIHTKQCHSAVDSAEQKWRQTFNEETWLGHFRYHFSPPTGFQHQKLHDTFI